jgi:hypothetical protein
MPTDAYKKLCETLRRRDSRHGARDIPEFYALAEELFAPEEAEVQSALPRAPATTEMVAVQMGRDVA